MSLGFRQLALYRDTATVYRPVVPTGPTSIGTIKDALYEVVATGIPCKFFPNAEMSHMTPIGRLPAGAKAELEYFHFEQDQELDDTYIIKLTTTGHPDINKYFIVVGEPEKLPSSGVRKSNYLHAEARRQHTAPTLAP